MIAVTIGVGKAHAPMACLAAACVSKMLGLEVAVLGTAEMGRFDLTRPHHLKFHLFDFFPDEESILFFDADLAILEPVDPDRLRSDVGFSAVHDLGECWWIQNDARRAGIPAEDYFNSGLFWISRERVALLKLAKRMKDEKLIEHGFHDQTFLNAAASQTGGVHYLPREFNYHVDLEHTVSLDHVIGAHFHSLKADIVQGERYFTSARTMFWKK